MIDDQHTFEARLARLADGELSPAEYRDLLTRLDQNPELWRPCALTLLEAQALRLELGALRREASALPLLPVTPRSVLAASPAPTKNTLDLRLRKAWPVLLAMAASFLLALTLGINMTWRPFDARPSELAAGKKGPEHANAFERGAESQIGKQPPQTSENIADSNSNPTSLNRVPQRLTVLVGDGDGRRQPIDLPVVSSNQIDDRQLWQSPTAIPLEVRQWLERAGHRVRNSRQVVPLHLPDGRRVLVPIEQLEILPGEESMQ